MRKKISERNEFPNFDLFEEYQKIEYLFSEQKTIGKEIYTRHTPSLSIEEYISAACFNDWNLSGTFISIIEMRKELDIEKTKFTRETISEELVLDFLQFSANCVHRVTEAIFQYPELYMDESVVSNLLLGNIDKLTEKLNCSLRIDETTFEYYIIYKDDISTVVAIDNENIAESITEYKRIDNKGDLTRKGEILCTLYKKLESIKSVLKNTTYESLFKDATFLFNKTGVRHCIENDKQASATFLQMPPDKLEKWYDRTYDLFLTCMVTVKYLNVKTEIENIKQTTGE